jgi:hypothetical protein
VAQKQAKTAGFQTMTVYFMQEGIPPNEMKKKPVEIMVLQDGDAITGLTFVPGNKDYPPSDLNQLAKMFKAAFMGEPIPKTHSNIGDTLLHYAQAENGQKLDNGYKLRYRTPNSGVTAEEGIFVAINKALPQKIQNEIHDRMSDVMRKTLNVYHSALHMPSADTGLAPQI